MNIDNIGTNPTYASTSTIATEVQKSVNKCDGDSDTDKSQKVARTLGSDTFAKSTETDASDATYKPVKNKLSAEEIKAIKEDQANSKAAFIKKFISDTIANQNDLLGKSTNAGNNVMSTDTINLLTKIFGSVENAYPPIATTQEGAAKAIADGGAYSVNAVADRIMTMAKAFAGDDPVKLQKMKDAVMEGFSQAGLAFSSATSSSLPQICKDTMTEVMKRFDALKSTSEVTPT